MKLSNDPINKSFRQQLRRESTPSEKILWNRLRNRQINGLKFRQQHGFGNYVMDFYCPTIRLCIEIDGEVHNTEEAKFHDRERTLFLNQYGIKVIRFKNEEIENNIEAVINVIKDTINNGDWEFRYVKTPNPLN